MNLSSDFVYVKQSALFKFFKGFLSFPHLIDLAAIISSSVLIKDTILASTASAIIFHIAFCLHSIQTQFRLIEKGQSKLSGLPGYLC